jgi:hypothetical protein
MKTRLKMVVSLVVALALLLSLTPVVVTAVSPYNYGDVFAAVNNGKVWRYDNNGNFIEELDTGCGGFTTGMAFDSGGNLYVTCFTASQVVKFDNTGVNQGTFGSGYIIPESIVFDGAGDVYVGNLNNGIRKYDSSGTFIGTVINTRVDWFDLTADQSTFYYGQEGSNIPTVSNAIPGIPGPDFVAGGLSQAFAMRILSDGGLLVADNVDIKRFNAAGVQIDTYDAGINGWFALNLDPDGTSFWSGSFQNDTFYRFDIASGALLDTVNTGLGNSNLYGLVVYGEQTAATGSISGMKWDDTDGNGQKDINEPGLPGWIIRLTDEAGNVIAETTTGPNGEYGFGSLGAGTFHVSEVQQAGWTQTFPPGGTHTVPIDAGQNVQDVDFGNTEGEGPPPVEVGGDVFPVNKLAMLAPWLALAAVLIIGSILVMRRRRTAG